MVWPLHEGIFYVIFSKKKCHEFLSDSKDRVVPYMGDLLNFWWREFLGTARGHFFFIKWQLPTYCWGRDFYKEIFLPIDVERMKYLSKFHDCVLPDTFRWFSSSNGIDHQGSKLEKFYCIYHTWRNFLSRLTLQKS